MSEREMISIPLSDIEIMREMRLLQTRFFADRDKSVVGRCKSLERQVDAILSRLPSAGESNLFSEESKE